jgi:hypothetical protein
VYKELRTFPTTFHYWKPKIRVAYSSLTPHVSTASRSIVHELLTILPPSGLAKKNARLPSMAPAASKGSP